jgi:Immunoglobulin-like domain of bacterial spore germination
VWRRGFAGPLGVGVAVILVACGDTGNQSTSTTQPTAIALPSASPSASASATALPAAGPEATPIPDGSRIIIDSPDASSTIQSPLEVTGTASVDGGNVVVAVLDANGNELGRASTTATAAAPAFGHFDATVVFTGASSGSKGQIKVFGVNPRNGNPSWFYWITVRFA